MDQNLGISMIYNDAVRGICADHFGSTGFPARLVSLFRNGKDLTDAGEERIMPHLAGYTTKDVSPDRMSRACDVLSSSLRSPNVPCTLSRLEAAGFGVVNLVPDRLGRHGEPVRSRESQFALALDGVIVNSDELRLDLQSGGYDSSMSDAALCMALFEKYGEDFVRRLEGQFNIVIHDARTMTTTLFNDRFGYRPMHYCSTDADLVFALERKAILALLPSARRLDNQGIIELFAFDHNLTDRTVFADIKVLPPAAIATWSPTSGGLQLRSYWRPEYRRRSERLSLDQYADEWSARLMESTRLWANTSDQIGLFLSGGLDSRVVAGELGPLGRQVMAFSIGQPEHPDVQYGTMLAQRLQFLHTRLQMAEDDLSVALPRVVWRTEGAVPFHNCTSIQNHDKIHPHATLVFNGHFGDVLSGGHLLPEYFRIRQRAHLTALLLARRSRIANPWLPRLFTKRTWSQATEQIRSDVAASIELLGEDHPALAYNLWDITVRQTRFTFSSPAVDRYLFEQVSPFANAAVTEWAMGIPLRFLVLQRAYRRMIVRNFPAIRDVPWTRTGHAISSGLSGQVVAEVRRKIERRRAQSHSRNPGRRKPVGLWHPALRARLDIFEQSPGFDGDLIDREGFRSLLEAHFERGEDLSDLVALLLTLAETSRLFVEGDPLAPPADVVPIL